MLTFSPSNQEGISGFVSKELFQSLLKLGITILIISIVLNRTVMKPPVIVDIFNLFLMLTYFFSLMMVEKLHLNFLMRIAMSSTALTFFVLVLFHPAASIWLIIIPCIAFALFGAREGFQWSLLGFISLLVLFGFDLNSSAPTHDVASLINHILVYLVLTLITWFYMIHIEQSHKAILKYETEKERLNLAQALSGGVAHLINNEMQVVVGTAELLLSKTECELNRRHLEIILNSGNQASSHAANLLAYAQGGVTQSEPFDLKAVIQDFVEKRQAGLTKNITFALDIPESLPLFTGDQSQIKIVLATLLENAEEACEKVGSIKISLTLDNLKKNCTSRDLDSGCYFKLTITDDGSGIEAGVIRKVFEPFFSTKFEGKGLGLAATQGITKNHGGNILVESTHGQGSAFTVWLPVHSE